MTVGLKTVLPFREGLLAESGVTLRLSGTGFFFWAAGLNRELLFTFGFCCIHERDSSLTSV